MIITSKANPLIKKIVALGEKKFRKEYGEYLIEGVKPVNECRDTGCEITCVVCSESLSASYPDAIVVSDELFCRISSEKSPQGVLAIVKLPDTGVTKPNGCCLLLDRLQDPGNLGTIIRTANAAGYEDLYLINCADAFSPKTVRASMSGIFHVRIHEGTYDEIFNALDGVPLICADMSGDNVFEFKSPENFCLCIGNEGGGLSRIVRDKADYTIKIPMRSTCESLNAGVSAAIAMYALKNNR